MRQETFSRLRSVRWRLPLSVAAASSSVLLALPVIGGFGGSQSVAVANSSGPVVLTGEGSWDVDAEEPSWHNDVFGSGSGVINVQYTPQGGSIGQQDYLAGELDYLISGVPFTPQQLQQLPGGASDVIAAPIMPSALGILLDPPSGDNDESLGVFEGPEGASPNAFQPYTGPVNLPYENLMAMLLNDKTTQPNGLRLEEWDNPDILASWPQCAAGDASTACLSYDPTAGDEFIPDSITNPESILQSEPNEDNYYLQELATLKAPVVWSDEATFVKQFGDTFGPVTSSLEPGIALAAEAQGVISTLTKIKGDDLISGGPDAGGILSALPPWSLGDLHTMSPNVPAEWVNVENAAGNWVSPTPASITAAVDAGGASPLYALTNSSSATAYPLTWVDDLYAPAHGLSMDKTNALAGLIRYLVTDGQKYMAPEGDGRLSPALVVQALNAANQLVESNCTESGEQVVTDTSPGPDAPPTPGPGTIGLMAHCESAPAAPSTTTTGPTKTSAPTSTTPGTTAPPSSIQTGPSSTTSTTTATGSTSSSTTFLPATSSPGSSGSFFDSGPPLASDNDTEGENEFATTTTTGTVAAGSGPSDTTAPTPSPAEPPISSPSLAGGKPKSNKRAVDAAVTAASLPIVPAGRGGFDHVAALVIGAGIFLALRRPIRSWVKALAR